MNFKFLNIPVRVHPSFFLLLFFCTEIYRGPSIESITLGIVVALSIIVHEYGHALTALYFGTKPSITLEALGGLAEYDGRGITPFQNFIITLNGPLSNCLLISLSYALLKLDFIADHSYIGYFLAVTMRINILLFLLNLIPVYPLDGGQLTRYLLERTFGNYGYKASVLIGLICIALLTPYLFYRGYFVFSTLLILYGLKSLQIFPGSRPLFEKENPFRTYSKGVEAFNNQENDTAKIAFKKLLKSKDTQIKHSAIESLAKIYYQEKAYQKAYNLLLKSDHQLLSEGKCLLCKLAFDQKNYDLIAKYSREIYTLEPVFEVAILNSKAFAFLKEPSLAGAWLITASQFGESYRDKVKEILSLQLYDQVRDHENFKQQLSKI